MFEKIALPRQWPKEEWVTLIRGSLIGKAQAAYVALDLSQIGDYDLVHQTVLKAYELVPEAYRQSFRTEKVKPGQTYLYFARQQEAAFDKWLRASDVYDFKQLRELMVLEQFKQSLPRVMQTHLNDLDVKAVFDAAEAADNYALTHRDSWRDRPSGPTTRVREVEGNQGDGNSGGHRQSMNSQSGERQFRFSPTPGDIICHYCRRPGHIKSRCPALQRGEGYRADMGPPVAINLLGVGLLQGPVEGVGETDLRMFDGFLSGGMVAVGEGMVETPLTVLRDTASGQSVMVAGTINLPETAALGTFVPIEGFGGAYSAVPLYKVFVRTNVFVGYAQVGVVSGLPVKGITFLLGNDLARTQVVVTPHLSATPCEVEETRALEKEYPEVFPVCVVTRSQSKVRSLPTVDVEDRVVLDPPAVDLADSVFAKWCGVDQLPLLSHHTLVVEQSKDPTLSSLREAAVTCEEIGTMAEGFYFRDAVLMRKWRPPERPATDEWSVFEQIVLPQGYREDVLRLAHETPLAGHLGIRKTQAKVMRHCYWPKLHQDVVMFCRSCHSCQVVGKPNQKVPVAPLSPVPVVEEPFSKVVIDWVGPLPKTKKGNEFLLTVMDTTTRFPEAIPLRNIKARTVIEALIGFFSRFGLPKQVQHDRGSNFVSGVFQEVMCELGISQAVSSAYHPQSQGVLERAHQTLKTMLKTYSIQFPGDWDVALPFILFAMRDSLNESTGFTPFELVFGHEVRSPLKLFKEQLLQNKPGASMLQYVSEFKDRLWSACQVARDNLAQAQNRMKEQFDQRAVDRCFSVGDQVLALVPQRTSSLSASFGGPYLIVKCVGDKNYVISTPEGRRKTRLCHVNLLKKYQDRPCTSAVACAAMGQRSGEDDREEGETGKLRNITQVLHTT
ncbi:Retrovirus-related Pol polyprotein from transposon 412 [Merluccius polli]|uniref:Gypsy retrotransposon integrase-like protein 1 n=1 Tax=Merluccius polli TaxID=89951 RepID=A0AA47P148_MERPO|nr:Retrovirus-related Pol polyprotein from transposon 412 [Merluccius polli]